MKLTSLIKCVVLFLPLAAHAIPTTWNIDDPSGGFVGSFDYDAVAGYSNVAINGKDNVFTVDWTTVGSPTSDTLFTTGPGTFGTILELGFASSLDSATPPVATDFTIFLSSGDIFSTGSFSITTDVPPVYDRPSGGVPAPATLALFGLGLAGLGWSRRKKV